MAFMNTMDKFGDEKTISMIIERSITEYCDDSVTTIPKQAFRSCTALVVMDVPKAASIAANSLYDCSAITALILRNTELVCSLGATSALTNTAIAKGTGFIYVPATLKTQYASATNWSTYAAQFRALEDYTVDGTVDGDIDMSKI